MIFTGCIWLVYFANLFTDFLYAYEFTRSFTLSSSLFIDSLQNLKVMNNWWAKCYFLLWFQVKVLKILRKMFFVGRRMFSLRCLDWLQWIFKEFHGFYRSEINIERFETWNELILLQSPTRAITKLQKKRFPIKFQAIFTHF